MLVTAYHLLARKTAYHDPGADYYEHRHAERVRHRAVQLLERQGYRVILEPAPPLPPYIAAQASERSGETRGKCPEKARSRSGHALVASWSRPGRAQVRAGYR